MRMLRLLAAGKSLVGLKPPTARYQMTDPRALPKFGLANNPYQPKANPAVPPSPAPETKHSAALNTENSPSPTPVAVKPDEGASRITHHASRAPRESRLTKVLSGLLPRRTPSPRQASVPVQAELTLDKVRVVRNDLSDTDLEIVRAKKSPAPQAPAQTSSLSTPEPNSAATNDTSPPENKKTGWKPVLEETCNP